MIKQHHSKIIRSSLTGLTLWLIGCSGGLGGSGDSQLAAQGQQLFATHCAQCHGDDGSGGSGPDIRGSGNTTITAAVGGGGGHTTFENLTAQEISAIAAFLNDTGADDENGSPASCEQLLADEEDIKNQVGDSFDEGEDELFCQLTNILLQEVNGGCIDETELQQNTDMTLAEYEDYLQNQLQLGGCDSGTDGGETDGDGGGTSACDSLLEEEATLLNMIGETVEEEEVDEYCQVLSLDEQWLNQGCVTDAELQAATGYTIDEYQSLLDQDQANYGC
ncbi:MAG: hypothetical protein HJJLKODD_02432 [Phycisphaerae bacterium]|nr:hypothetical protein [Phycisphaerae bacterium]